MFLDRHKFAIQLTALMLAPLPVALGQIQETGSGVIREFEPVYFVEFDPLTALDMVDRIPGVSAEASDGGRGLSGVRSNLLINGERPPPKGKSAREQLDEMPVEGVVMIELIDAGARLDVDMQGYTQVINVITVENRPAYYELVTEVRRSGTGDNDEQNERFSHLDGTGSFSLGNHEFSITGNFQDQDSRSPPGSLRPDPIDPELRTSSPRNSDGREESLQFDAMFALPGDSTLSFNSQFSEDRSGSESLLFPGDEAADFVDQSSDGENDLRDFSAEYIRSFASNGELMVAFVDTTENRDSESFFQDVDSSRSFFTDSETGETATRLRMTNAPTDRLTFRTTVSNAFNYIDGDSRIFLDGLEFGSDTRVQEDRRSLESSVDWNLSDKWTFRGTVGIEAYEIETPDISSGNQTDPKSELRISFRPQRRTTFTLTTGRSVGQLNLSQFLASSDLESEIVTAGATGLKPERQKNLSASYDRRFGDLGVMRFSVARTETENPIRLTALSDSIVVRQNTSPKTVDSVQVSVDFPFERFGHEDLILSISSLFTDSETIDPITGETREAASGSFGGGGNRRDGGGGGGNWRGGGSFSGGSFGGFTPRYYKQIELRKDPGDGKWSWSVSYRDIQPSGNYSTRELGISDGERRWNGSFTWEPINGLFFRTNLDGPRTQTRVSDLFGAVRTVGLDPWAHHRDVNRQGTAASFTVEWRRNRLEITGSLSSRPDNVKDEYLINFPGVAESFQLTGNSRTPRAMLRFRITS